jgi:hypothetical protein
MRSVLTLSFVAVAVWSAGCVTTLRPLPEVRVMPPPKKPDATADTPSTTPTTPAPSSGVTGQPVADTTSSTSLSSRFTKLFGGQGSSDRTPLPRNDQPLEPSEQARQDLNQDF